ncbi:serine/threonine-protein kinase [Streptomyces chiangmaiensis]|uniref:non-specific serine/threonine protein kinase n=1 Tax=Streptomyces chiangmaiensis TaxID=766497 RepID=A0ABU7FMR1_9ACTN|nr:serine/threonine-protein kinase [Streptomyces chiangmaiensis]MED7825359.1 serine/threonine-protein kinase [Streptomyces chiangmaiensis]
MQSLERIDRYRLERRLGSGAFGVVWLAHDDVLEAPVAVKVLAENWAHRLDIRERFLSEARLLRRAGSSRVVQVYDIGELPDGRPYFVMEYADGGTLADRIDGSPLPVAEALRLTALAARSAEALHDAGIVHRDIKPSNVLLRTAPDGSTRLLLADLGLAKSLAQASGLTMAAGSAGYAAPEQTEPGSGIDARADVYSLGALGYHLLTGTVPARPGRVQPPDRLRPGLPAEVQRAVLRAMEPERERRWPTAEAFADALDRLAGTSFAAAPERPVRRRGGMVLAVAALVVAGVAAASTTLLLRQQPSAGVRVQDSTGRVHAVVPASWGRQLRDAGWNPDSLGLPTGHEPALAVADDLSRWTDLGADANGAFIGLSEHGDLTAKVRGINHTDCHYEGGHDYRGTNWRGVIRTWTDCDADGDSVTEAALEPVGGTGRPQVYVQLRQDGGSDETDRVLDSVRVTG